ncbi:MAG: protein-L-isoaspartate O-methyltransferase family protein [Novosphingobium sp.]
MIITEDRTASQAARRAMIDSQLRTSGVNEAWVLEAMNAVPREDFVPENARAAAYTDRAVPLGNGRFLAAPLVHGRMLAEAAPSPADSVLIVSGNGGYLAALVRPLVGALEVRDPADTAKLKKGAYSLILIDGAAEALPASIATALADDGRIVSGLVERGVTRLAVGRVTAGAIAWLPLAEIGIPVLPEFAAPRSWTF